MSLGNVARVAVVLGAVVAAAGSASSTSNPPPQTRPQYAQNQPPPPQQMEPSSALGLWRSTFGAVKIEADNSKGGLGSGAIQGIWVYERQGQEVVGYFAGNLRGNVLNFRWQEPNNPPLTGEGFLVFDPQGRQYSGRWWSDARDRNGDWNGWRNAPGQQQPQQPQPYGNQYGQPPYGQPQRDPYGGQPQPYGGQTYGGYPPSPYDRQQPPPYGQPQQPPPSPYGQPQQPPPPPRGYY